MTNLTTLSRRGFLIAASAAACCAGVTRAQAGMMQYSTGLFSMRSSHTGESLHVQFRSATGYDGDALRQIDWFMRDWRMKESKPFDARTLEMMSAIRNFVGSSAPFVLTSGYRSAATNDMLRSKGIKAARHSLHMQAQAVDLCLDGYSIKGLAQAASSCGAGGI
ncbi:MAG: DUF882 domain-containing protein, partial [Paracoccus sp. (in: a-proteobacteria)]|nr:DUF882 domain-containing protein [Paracoccus sp. (in: a-proteobacteria)]